MNQILIDFYRGVGSDDKGRYIEQLWQWKHQQLESVHDYIQWLFPSVVPSRYNPDAPLLDAETIQLFLTDDDLRQRLLKSFEVMLEFYGLEIDNSFPVKIQCSSNYEKRRANWQEPFRGSVNHNLLRLTRIMEALRFLGLPQHSLALCACLEEIQAEISTKIPERTLEFWRQAAGKR